MHRFHLNIISSVLKINNKGALKHIFKLVCKRHILNLSLFSNEFLWDKMNFARVIHTILSFILRKDNTILIGINVYYCNSSKTNGFIYHLNQGYRLAILLKTYTIFIFQLYLSLLNGQLIVTPMFLSTIFFLIV